MKISEQEFMVGLDVGTTKVCAVIGKQSEDGIEVIGVGQSPSHGLKQGMVVNIESTVTAIRKAVSEAELMAGCEVNKVVVGIADKFIRGRNSPGVVRVKNGEVSEQDVRRVIETAQTVALPPDREVLHIIPREFRIDDQDGVTEPLGMTCSRLEVNVHIVTAASVSIRNIIKACNQAGLQVSDIVLQSLASAEAVLMPDERELGVALIDIGGGTTDIAVMCNGSLWHTAEIPVAGNHLTGDLAVGLRVMMKEAELVKRKHGCCLKGMVDKNEQIEITFSGGSNKGLVPRQAIAIILQARAEEILTLVAKELRRSGLEGELAAGAVLTGGAALLPGMEDLAEQVLNMPVRIGSPINVRGLLDMVNSPVYSTGVGLVLHGARNYGVSKRATKDENGSIMDRAKQLIRRIWREFA